MMNSVFVVFVILLIVLMLVSLVSGFDGVLRKNIFVFGCMVFCYVFKFVGLMKVVVILNLLKICENILSVELNRLCELMRWLFVCSVDIMIDMIVVMFDVVVMYVLLFLSVVRCFWNMVMVGFVKCE